ncbi:ATP-binding protein [Nonomuraea candida]|uniref:ATP-binding protein n=1 Tax=Nonomuraea candida TaxID=359159 RepID=UPI000694C49A|nr:LuxR family transcriptional regulator [Nonomuraea candida]
MVSLVGREREVAAIDAVLARSPEQGDALIVRGPAGIGKTALLEAAMAGARGRGMTVMSTAGVEGEAHLPFAGLHLLLLPLLDAVAKLPPRQREALDSAFGRGQARVEPFLIAMAVLTLLGEAAASRPLLVVVDDVHWLDAPTVEALAFVARRIRADPIAVLFAVRDDHRTHLDDCGLSELTLGGLGHRDAETLLDRRAPRLGAGARRRVLAEADGNPLALVELPRVVDGEPEPGPAALLPLTARLERAFAVRLADLPPPTRALLLAAAADDGRHLATALAAGSLVAGERLTVAALTPATEGRLIDLAAGEFRFRHPLVRSAIYHRATPGERLAVHQALAEVHAADPDRQAWHRAAALSHPDAAVATELVNVARRAHRRGAVAVAVAALRRSAQLTEGPTLRANRLLQAAELAFELGDRALLADLLAQVDPGVLTALGQARLAWLREVLEEGRTPVSRLIDTIESVSTLGDTALAMNVVRAAATRCWWTEPGPDVRRRVAELAERLAPSPDDPELLACLSLAGGLERGAEVIERLRRLRGARLDGVQNRLLGVAATCVGAFDLAGGFLEAAVAELRAQGRLGALTQALSSLIWEQVFCGDWAGANLVADECERLAREIGQPRWVAAALAARALLAGQRGQAGLGRALAAEAERELGPNGAASVLALVLYARGVTALCAGQHAEAFGYLRRIADAQDVAYHPLWRLFSVSEMAEAAVGSGQEEAFRAILAELEEAAAGAPAPLAHVGLRHARALLADAEPLYEAALAADLTRWPTARARIWLAHGSWLRRHKRVKEARESLRTARDTCDALGLAAWGERARQELRAAGETAAGRVPAGSDNLSAQELQIARLAAAGLSNREIGQQLYLSHRTVSTHLYRVFPKLGISSRAQLRDALGL